MAVAQLAKLCGVVAITLASVAVMSSAQATTPNTEPPIPVPRPSDIAVAERIKGIAPFGDASSEKELRCLAQAIYFEARSEPERGQRAVADSLVA